MAPLDTSRVFARVGGRREGEGDDEEGNDVEGWPLENMQHGKGKGESSSRMEVQRPRRTRLTGDGSSGWNRM